MGNRPANFDGGNADVGAMAQMMLANYDADGSGALNAVELASALQGLRQMMMQGGGGNANAQNGQAANFQPQNRPAQRPAQGQAQAGGDARMQRFGRRGR